MNIDKQQILAERDRILASPSFRNRKLIKQFFRYIIQETLNGRGNDLNQYTIAVHALGKQADFSPINNPVVRIEAGRLRKLLDSYYQDSSNHGNVIINMPKGSYQAEFSFPSPIAALTTPEVSALRITEGPRLFMHFQVLHLDNEAMYPLLYKLRGELLLMLSRFRNIRLVSSVSLETGLTLTRQVMQQMWEQNQADYILNCDINATAEGFELCYMLAHTRSDEIAWNSTITLPPPSDTG